MDHDPAVYSWQHVTPAPGTRVGVYEITALLGEGGMGQVYRATDTRLKRQVAVKILPATLAADADRLARFQREAEILAALNHPNIAGIHGLEESSGVVALIMELVEGEDLSVRIMRGAIRLDEALPIAGRIAEALEAAHEQGIIHRDLKPANIKVRVDGAVKVLDFGVAKALEPAGGGRGKSAHAATSTSPALTQTGAILGTAAYMSPEQARGQPVDVRTDLWAFGCVLFEMLTGSRAFRGASVADTLAAVVTAEPRWEDLPQATPPALLKLLRRCLAKDRSRRMASASDARLEIEDALNPNASAELPPHPGPGPRRAWTFAIGLGIGVLAAAAGAYLLWGSAPPTAPPTVTRLVIQPPPGTQLISGHREVAVSADGRQVAFIARGAAEQHIYVRRLDELESKQVSGTDGARDLAFSPDGQWIAFHAREKISKVRLSGGVPTELAASTHAHGLAWHPAEDAIYFALNGTSGIWKVPAGGGTAVAVTTLDKARGEQSHDFPLFSPDGRTLLFSVNAMSAEFDKEEVSLLTLQTGQRENLRTGGDAVGFTDNGDVLFVRARSLMSAPYNATRHVLASEAVEMVSGVRRDSSATASVSRSGTLAYVPSPDINRRSLVWISSDGTAADANFGRRHFVSAAISPNGRRVAVTAGFPMRALYVADAAGGTLTPVNAQGSQDMTWSPDGHWIAGTINGELSRILAIGGQWESLLTDSARNRAQQWIAEGLLFSRREDFTSRSSLRVLAPGSSPPKVSMLMDSVDGTLGTIASLSSDGHWLAYESRAGGAVEVYVQAYPLTTDTAPLKISTAGGAKPRWAKNNQLIFLTNTTFMVATVSTRPELHADTPRPIVDEPLLVQGSDSIRPYEVAPDGRILAVKEDDSVRSDHIVVVQNWLSELRAPVAGSRKTP